MYRRALALVAVVAAAAAGDAPAGPYDNPICGTAASPCKPCNRTFRIGAPRLAAPAALGIMGKSLDFLDACFAFYDQPSGVVSPRRRMWRRRDGRARAPTILRL